MRSKSFIVIAAAVLVAPACTRDEGPAGQWRGFVLQGGVRAPVDLELSNEDDRWSGAYRVGGVSTPLDDLRVTGHAVQFAVEGQGTFDGTVDGDTLAGTVAGGSSSGSFKLVRQRVDDPIHSEGP
jgi:hypothetical protein